MTALAASSSALLARLLETPDLPRRIAALEPAALGRLIDRVGLEDAGELVAFATTEQIAHLFDEDLWTNERPGEEERFDGRRFGVWLEVMLESGDAALAQRLVELPEDLVTLAFHDRMHVLRVDELFARMSELEEREADALEKALANQLSEELDEFQLIARNAEGWDAVLSAILALDRDHHDFVVRLLDRCAALTSSRVDDEGGLYEVLSESETLTEDVAGDREDRRAEAGHVAPSAAAAFLKLAEQPLAASDAAKTARDPLTRAYFRRLGAPAATAAPRSRGAGKKEWPRLLGPSPGAGVASKGPAPELPLARALRDLAGTDPAAFALRAEELAYVANVLLAGASIDGDRLRPADAAQAALAYVNLGFELAGTLLPAEVLFRLAYSRLQGLRRSASGGFIATRRELGARG
jgi:hypothetical protein